MVEHHEGEAVQVPCSECHYESEWLGYYDHELIYGWPGLLAYDRYDWWYDYYRRPWWYRDYWYDDPYYHCSESTPSGEGISSWRKRPTGREGPGPVIPGGTVYPGGPGGGSGGSSPAAPSSGSSASPSTKKQNNPEPSHRKKKPRSR